MTETSRGLVARPLDDGGISVMMKRLNDVLMKEMTQYCSYLMRNPFLIMMNVSNIRYSRFKSSEIFYFQCPKMSESS